MQEVGETQSLHATSSEVSGLGYHTHRIHGTNDIYIYLHESGIIWSYSSDQKVAKEGNSPYFREI